MSNFSRAKIKRGGSCIFVNNNYAKFSQEVTNISSLSIENLIEISAVSIKIKNETYYVVCFYRPPNDNRIKDSLKIFLKTFENALLKIPNNAHILLTGDLNIDNLSKSDAQRSLINILDSFNLKIVNESASRISNTSTTQIDYLITKIIHSIIN
uniref:Endonuclease/exonuclease/phosphatase domain-containing protein n=1 Tax=Cacopsylla melanoneura TaxID=428564 RepID=A0A8D9EII3_9HEMI